jgi:flagellar protein FliO/FliZ
MEAGGLFRVLLSFGFVLGLMLAIAWLARRFGLDKRLMNARNTGVGGQLACEETLYLDPRRRVVILRRGTKRHLLLLGQQSDILVESYDADEERPRHL